MGRQQECPVNASTILRNTSDVDSRQQGTLYGSASICGTERQQVLNPISHTGHTTGQQRQLGDRTVQTGM